MHAKFDLKCINFKCILQSKKTVGHVAKLYTGPDRDAETDEEVVEQPQIKLDETLVALQSFVFMKSSKAIPIET